MPATLQKFERNSDHAAGIVVGLTLMACFVRRLLIDGAWLNLVYILLMSGLCLTAGVIGVYQMCLREHRSISTLVGPAACLYFPLRFFVGRFLFGDERDLADGVANSAELASRIVPLSVATYIATMAATATVIGRRAIRPRVAMLSLIGSLAGPLFVLDCGALTIEWWRSHVGPANVVCFWLFAACVYTLWAGKVASMDDVSRVRWFELRFAGWFVFCVAVLSSFVFAAELITHTATRQHAETMLPEIGCIATFALLCFGGVVILKQTPSKSVAAGGTL